LADDDDVDFLHNEDANVRDLCLLPQLLYNASHFFHEEFGKRLNKVMALTAFGDPLYCEAIVTMHSYDIVLDIFIVNRTAGRLRHHCFATLVTFRRRYPG
jgi:vesicle coat complex subunit